MRNKERHLRGVPTFVNEIEEVLFEKPVLVSSSTKTKKITVGRFKLQTSTQRMRFQTGYKLVPLFRQFCDKTGQQLYWNKPVFKTKVVNHQPVVVQ